MVTPDAQTAATSNVADLEKRLAKAEEQVAILAQLEADSRGAHRKTIAQKAKFQRHLRIASIPWLILLAPLTAIWAVVYLVKKVTAKRPQKSLSEEMGLYGNPKFNTRHVFDAFMLLKTFGSQEAIQALDDDPASTPDGAKALFEAYDAPSDAAWEEATNRFLATQSKCRLKVAKGEAPRFGRISFDEATAIERDQKISVIMPAFNAEKWLELAVGSILNQSWRNLELIVVNDKSTDGTGAMLDALAKTDDRLIALHNPVNVGPYVSKNVALSFATGDFITGHDADDIALPDRLERQVTYLRENSKLEAVIGQMVRLDDAGCLSFAKKAGSASYDGLHRPAMISLMMRRAVFDRFGYWDSVRFGADSEYLARLRTHIGPQIKEVPDLTMLCLSAPESLTNNVEHGITAAGGLSPIRVQYKDSWRAWHIANSAGALHRAFSNANRPHDAPDKMRVPQADIETLQAHYAALRASS